MSGGTSTTLGDVATFIRGITFKPDDVVPVGSPGSLACMRTKNIQTELDLSDVWGIPEVLVRRRDQRLRSGDILVSSANSWNLVGKCCWVPELPWESTFGGFVSVLRPDVSKVDPRYLYRWFASNRIQATARSFGQQTTNISNLNIDRCLKLEVKLPSLAEQKRLAEILDMGDALRTKRRAVMTQLDELTNSIFLDMFGDPATNPRGISQKPLGELIKLKSGNFLPAMGMAEAGSYPVFGGNGLSGFHDQYMFHDPQIVIGRVGAYCGCIHVSPANSWITDNALYVSDRSDDLMFDYLVHALIHARLNQYASQSGQPLVSGSRIYPVRVLVPPKDMQAEFARRVARVAALRVTNVASSKEFGALFASLEHRAFRGEL